MEEGAERSGVGHRNEEIGRGRCGFSEIGVVGRRPRRGIAADFHRIAGDVEIFHRQHIAGLGRRTEAGTAALPPMITWSPARSAVACTRSLPTLFARPLAWTSSSPILMSPPVEIGQGVGLGEADTMDVAAGGDQGTAGDPDGVGAIHRQIGQGVEAQAGMAAHDRLNRGIALIVHDPRGQIRTGERRQIAAAALLGGRGESLEAVERQRVVGRDVDLGIGRLGARALGDGLDVDRAGGASFPEAWRNRAV